VQNYVPTEHGPRWRTAEDGLPASAAFISSPYDTQAHYARKRSTTWVGYKVHLTETCDDETPHLITHVETTPAPETSPVDGGSPGILVMASEVIYCWACHADLW